MIDLEQFEGKNLHQNIYNDMVLFYKIFGHDDMSAVDISGAAEFMYQYFTTAARNNTIPDGIIEILKATILEDIQYKAIISSLGETLGDEDKTINSLNSMTNLGLVERLFSNNKLDVLILRKMLAQLYSQGSYNALISDGGSTEYLTVQVTLSDDYIDEVTKHIDIIRKIIRKEEAEDSKRNVILKKLNALQAELDKTGTTFDNFLSRAVDVSETIKKASDNLPLMNKVENLIDACYKIINQDMQLIGHDGAEEQKLLTDQSANGDNGEA